MANQEAVLLQDHNKFVRALRGSILKTGMENKKEDETAFNRKEKQVNLQKLASTILDAQKIRVDSFNHAVSDTMPTELRDTFGYDKTIYEAADEATAKAGFGLRILQLIFILNSHAETDICLWAHAVLKQDTT